MSSLPRRLLDHIRRQELLLAGDRVGVAVSGGIDSVALLRVLLELRSELGIVLSVVHFNHKLRGAESDADQEFVAALAREHGLVFYSESDDAAQLAAEEYSGLEAAARELRYEFFHRLLGADDEFTSAAEAADDGEGNRSAGSAAPSKSEPQGLTPQSTPNFDGTAEAVPFQNLDKIATGHTLDDQAETVLMRMIRGTGLRGLGGIYPRIVIEDEDGDGRGEIVRPLLGIRRRELEQYLTGLKQPWREDATNTDCAFTRNRVRKVLLPLIEREFNPSIAETLSDLAEIAREEEDYWQNEAEGWLGTVIQWSQPEWARGLPGFDNFQSLVQIAPQGSSDNAERDAEIVERVEHADHAVANASVSRPWLVTEPTAVQRRVIKAIGEQAGIPLEFKHVEEVLRFAAEDGPSEKELTLPRGWKLLREPAALLFVSPDLRQAESIPDYKYSLPIPGRVLVPEIGAFIEAHKIQPQEFEALSASAQPRIAAYSPDQLLDPKLVGQTLIVRNWRPGDRYWPAHTKSPKKIKELLQEKNISQPQRRLWPVALSGREIIWMRGFPLPAKLTWKRDGPALLIRQMRFEEDSAI